MRRNYSFSFFGQSFAHRQIKPPKWGIVFDIKEKKSSQTPRIATRLQRAKNIMAWVQSIRSNPAERSRMFLC